LNSLHLFEREKILLESTIRKRENSSPSDYFSPLLNVDGNVEKSLRNILPIFLLLVAIFPERDSSAASRWYKPYCIVPGNEAAI
jgi:hypothetical protein